MYSSVSDAEYQFRRAKAEQEARHAREQSLSSEKTPVAEPVSSEGVHSVGSGERLRGFLSRIREDDALILGLLVLLFNETKDDDPLILIVLAVLLFT